MAKRQGNESPDGSVEMNDFPGIFLLTDPIDLPPGGGQDQLNLKSDQGGTLQVRNGMLVVSFDYQG